MEFGDITEDIFLFVIFKIVVFLKNFFCIVKKSDIGVWLSVPRH